MLHPTWILDIGLVAPYVWSRVLVFSAESETTTLMRGFTSVAEIVLLGSAEGKVGEATDGTSTWMLHTHTTIQTKAAQCQISDFRFQPIGLAQGT